MNCAVYTKRVLSSYSNRSLCQRLMNLFHDPLIKYSGCNLVMPCTSDSGHTSKDVWELARPGKICHTAEEEAWNTETFFLPTAHLTEHFNVIALKLAICFDCSHHSQQRSFLVRTFMHPFLQGGQRSTISDRMLHGSSYGFASQLKYV